MPIPGLVREELSSECRRIRLVAKAGVRNARSELCSMSTVTHFSLKQSIAITLADGSKIYSQ